jgi:hypothetical protein
MQSAGALIYFYLLLLCVCRNFILYNYDSIFEKIKQRIGFKQLCTKLHETFLTLSKRNSYDKNMYMYYKITEYFVKFLRIINVFHRFPIVYSNNKLHNSFLSGFRIYVKHTDKNVEIKYSVFIILRTVPKIIITYYSVFHRPSIKL